MRAVSPHEPVADPVDVRAAGVLTPSRIGWFARRLLSIASLATLDVLGLGLGLYATLLVRDVYYGRSPDAQALWQSETEWLPFLVLVTLLVFAQGDLYAERERRPGVGRVVSSLLLVTLITLAFGLGTGHDFSTYGTAPTAFVLTALLISLSRAAYDGLTGLLLRRVGIRRRVLLVGVGEHLTHLHETLGEVEKSLTISLADLTKMDTCPARACRCSRFARPRSSAANGC